MSFTALRTCGQHDTMVIFTSRPCLALSFCLSITIGVVEAYPVYVCSDIYTCPSRHQSVLTPAGSLKLGYKLNRSYLNDVCKYFEDFLTCAEENSNFYRTCEYVSKTVRLYGRIYNKLCVGITNRASVASLLPCLTKRDVQLDIYGYYTQFTGSIKAILEFPPGELKEYQPIKDVIACSSLYDFRRNCRESIETHCGNGREVDSKRIIGAFSAILENTFGFSCPVG